MAPDRIDWIFDTDSDSTLEQRYDAWASTYDRDHSTWGWKGPELVASATLRHLNQTDATATIVDAGSGTGMVGVALRRASWTGRLVGLDLSKAMLDQAARRLTGEGGPTTRRTTG